MLALIDTHTHLFTEEFDADRALAIIRAKEAGVTRMFMPNIMILRWRLCWHCAIRTTDVIR